MGQKDFMTSTANKIMLLGAGFTTTNMGVWALASGAIASALHAHPDAKICLLDYHITPDKYQVRHPAGGAVAVELLNLRFSKKFWLPNNIARLLLTALAFKAVPSKSLREYLYSKNHLLNHIRASDIVGSIAGGDSFSDIYGFLRFIYIILPQILVLLTGKSMELLPQTIGPFHSAAGRFFARNILKRAHRIYSRDREGLETIRELIGAYHDQFEFCHDLGFIMEPNIQDERVPLWLAERDKKVPLVGINVSGLLYMGGYTRNNMFGLEGNYQTLVHGLIDKFIHEKKSHVMLVPHVLGSEADSESDTIACRRIFSNSKDRMDGRLHLIEDGYDQHELKALIGCCDFFLGSRMHACIAALSQSIPAVGLAYSRKFQGVFSSIGMDELVVDLRSSDEFAALQIVDRAYEDRMRFSTQLEAEMKVVRSKVKNLFVNLL